MAGIRMTGLISNMDTESVVEAMMDAHRLKLTKIENKKTKLEWKQDKWKELNTKLYKLYQEQTSKLHLVSNYNINTATSADESVVKVTAGKGATQGTHSIAVKQLASSQYVTGGQVSIANFDKKSALTEAGFKSGDIIKITNGTKTVELNVDSKTTVNDFLTSCTNAGLNASYDETQKRFFISAKESGADNAFTITSGSYTSEGAAAREGILNLIDTSSSSAVSKANTALLKLKQGGDTTDAETELKKLAVQKLDTEATQKANKFYYEVAKKNTTLSDEEITQIEETYSEIEDEEERNAKIDAAKKEKLEQKISEKLNTEEYKTKINDAIANGIDNDTVTTELGITEASELELYTFEDKTTRTLSAENEMNSAITKFKNIYATSGDNSYSSSDSPLNKLGLGEINNVTDDLSSTTTGSYTLISAKNSKIIYNGVEMENSTNTISVNGLTFEAISLSSKVGDEYKPTSVTVSKNSQGMYDMVKEFITQYNTILGSMNELYYADSARGYEPLTDEEREAMTDDQIKMWEDKIKNSSLRRDSTLGGIISAMNDAMLRPVEIEVDGELKSYSLSSFGIMTSRDYSEKGLLHIYGDKDDATYADKDDKLMKAIEEDPDTFAKVMAGITDNLHTALNKKMSKTSLSSALTFYNDKQINNQITQYKKDISKLEAKLEEKEAAYYKQFTAMEKALASLQEQQSALSGLLGTS